MEIKYLSGQDIRHPYSKEEVNVILHCCNDMNVMGAGVARALFEMWPEVKSMYHFHFENDKKCKLGDIHYVKVENQVFVGNIIGQHCIREDEEGNPPVRYWAIEQAFENVVENILNKDSDVNVNIPYLMGCDLAGGKWEKIEELIHKHFIANEIPVYVYDLFRKRG